MINYNETSNLYIKKNIIKTTHENFQYTNEIKIEYVFPGETEEKAERIFKPVRPTPSPAAILSSIRLWNPTRYIHSPSGNFILKPGNAVADAGKDRSSRKDTDTRRGEESETSVRVGLSPLEQEDVEKGQGNEISDEFNNFPIHDPWALAIRFYHPFIHPHKLSLAKTSIIRANCNTPRCSLLSSSQSSWYTRGYTQGYLPRW